MVNAAIMADLRGVVRRLQESIDGLGSLQGSVQGSINEESVNCSPISRTHSSYLMTPPRICGVDSAVCEDLGKVVELGVEKNTSNRVVKQPLESSLDKLEEEMRQSKRRCQELELASKESNGRVKALEQEEKQQKMKIDELEGRVVQTSVAWKQAEQSLTRNRKRADELGNEKHNLLKKLKRLQEELDTAKQSSDEGVNLRKENEKLNKRCSLLEISLREYKAVEKAAVSDLGALSEALARPAYIPGTVSSPFLLGERKRRKGKSLKSLNGMEDAMVKLSNEVQRCIKEWKAARDDRKEALKETEEARLRYEELRTSLDVARGEISKAFARSTLLEEKLSQRCAAHATLLEASAAAGESLSRLLPAEEREVLESSLAFAETGAEEEQDNGEVQLQADTKVVHFDGLRALTSSNTLDIEDETERALVRKARLVPLCAWRLAQVLEHGAQSEEELASMRSRLEEADHSAKRFAREVNDLKCTALEQGQIEKLNAVRAAEREQDAKANAEKAMAELVAEKEKNSAMAMNFKAQAVELQHCKQLKESAIEHEQIAKAEAERAKGELVAEKENNATLSGHLKLQAAELAHSEELRDSGKESLRLIARFFLPFRAQLYELKSQKRFLSEQFRQYSPVREALNRAASCIEGRNYWALPKPLHAVDIAHAVVTHPVEGDCLRLPPCFRSVVIVVLTVQRMMNLLHMSRHHSLDVKTEKEGKRTIVDVYGDGGYAGTIETDCIRSTDPLAGWSNRKEGKGWSSFFSLPRCLPDSAVPASPEFLSVDKLRKQAPETSLNMLLNCFETQTYQWPHHCEMSNDNGDYSLLTWLQRGNASHYTRLAYLTERTSQSSNDVSSTGVNRVLRARAAYVDLCRCLALGDMQRLSSLTRTTATLAREMNRLMDEEGKKVESSCALCETSKEREKCMAEATSQAIKTLEAERSDAAALARALHSKIGELKRCTLAAESALAIAREDRNETAESLRKAEGAIEHLKNEVYSLNKEKVEYVLQKDKVLLPLQHDLEDMRESCGELERRADRAEAEVVYLQMGLARVRSIEEQRKILVQEQTAVLKSIEDIVI